MNCAAPAGRSRCLPATSKPSPPSYGLIAALRRTAAERGAPAPRIQVADQLLDVWIDARS